MAEITNRVDDGTALGFIGKYYKEQSEYKEELAAEMLVYTALAIAQMVTYWVLANDQINNRDRVIGEYDPGNDGMLGFLAKLEEYRDNYDYPILLKKAAVKDGISADLARMKPNSCADSVRYLNDLANDARAIDKMEEMFASCSCSGIPEGWGTHDGSLSLGLGASYVGPVMNVGTLTRYLDYKYDGIGVVQQAQSAMKAIYNISGVMGYYAQAISIFQGLADLFISGFNSAGAMLGTAIGQLASQNRGSLIKTNELGHTGYQSTVHPKMLGGAT